MLARSHAPCWLTSSYSFVTICKTTSMITSILCTSFKEWILISLFSPSFDRQQRRAKKITMCTQCKKMSTFAVKSSVETCEKIATYSPSLTQETWGGMVWLAIYGPWFVAPLSKAVLFQSQRNLVHLHLRFVVKLWCGLPRSQYKLQAKHHCLTWALLL